MRLQFYETSVVGYSDGRSLGFQVLTSPREPSDTGLAPQYDTLLDDFDQVRKLTSLAELGGALGLLNLPSARWPDMVAFEEIAAFETSLIVFEAGETLRERRPGTNFLHAPLIAAETSPLRKQTLAELFALSGGAYLAVVADLPMVVIVGGTVGLVVIRGATAVGGALWEGARGEFARFGEDLAAMALDIVRRKLGIERTSRVTDSAP